MIKLYEDGTLTAEDCDGMLRIDVRPTSLGDGLHTDAWLDSNEALKLAHALLGHFQGPPRSMPDKTAGQCSLCGAPESAFICSDCGKAKAGNA